MKINLNFEQPYFEEKLIFDLKLKDLDDFYANVNEVDRLNLFFVLEASLHRFQRENKALQNSLPGWKENTCRLRRPSRALKRFWKESYFLNAGNIDDVLARVK